MHKDFRLRWLVYILGLGWDRALEHVDTTELALKEIDSIMKRMTFAVTQDLDLS